MNLMEETTVKKVLFFSLTLLLGLMFVAAPMAKAGSKCNSMKLTACSGQKSPDSKNLTGDLCKDYEGKCEDITLAIKGMTCPGCESSLKKALEAEEGVIKICSIDHKSGQAVVCFDPDKIKAEKLAETVTKSGYKAEIAQVADTKAATVKSAKSGCSPKCLLSGKGCSGIKTAKATDTKSGKSSSE